MTGTCKECTFFIFASCESLRGWKGLRRGYGYNSGWATNNPLSTSPKHPGKAKKVFFFVWWSENLNAIFFLALREHPHNEIIPNLLVRLFLINFDFLQ